MTGCRTEVAPLTILITLLGKLRGLFCLIVRFPWSIDARALPLSAPSAFRHFPPTADHVFENKVTSLIRSLLRTYPSRRRPSILLVGVTNSGSFLSAKVDCLLFRISLQFPFRLYQPPAEFFPFLAFTFLDSSGSGTRRQVFSF